MLLFPPAKPGLDFRFRDELPEDNDKIEALYDEAFGPGRFTRAAHFVREACGLQEDLSKVCLAGGEIVASIRFSPIAIGSVPALMLGPLVVAPSERSKGYGKALMAHAIDAAWLKGHDAVVLVGDAPYYKVLGFQPLPFKAVKFPAPVDPARVLGLAKNEAILATLKGVVGPRG